jgi:hypothetical protein
MARKSEFLNCKDFDADCNAAPDDCQSPVTTYIKNATSAYYHEVFRNDIMTNQTACMDGYSQGWEHSCQIDGKACVFLFPDASVVRKINGTWYRCDVERISCGSTNAGTNHVLFHNGTATNQTVHWNYDARAGWFGWQ